MTCAGISAQSNVRFIAPKQIKRSYKKQHYTVTFIPKTKTWKWQVTVVVETRFTTSDEADTQIKAFRAAEKFIDQHVRS